MKTNRLFFLSLLMIVTAGSNAQMAYYQPAENYGGKQALKDLTKLEMVYPEEARENNEKGTVVISFTVNPSGEPENIRVTQPVSESLDQEALRLFSLLLWTPARSKGTTISEDLETEFNFKLKKYLKEVKHRGYDQIPYPYSPVCESLEVYKTTSLDSMPRPVYDENGMKFADFIIQNMKYPDAAQKQGISGTVELFFVVEPSGNITNYKIEKSVGAGCNEEAIRLLKLLRWYPGIKDGKAVRTAMKLSITFNLEDSENMRYVPANNASQI